MDLVTLDLEAAQRPPGGSQVVAEPHLGPLYLFGGTEGSGGGEQAEAGVPAPGLYPLRVADSLAKDLSATADGQDGYAPLVGGNQCRVHAGGPQPGQVGHRQLGARQHHQLGVVEGSRHSGPTELAGFS
jgi:hypothetical protein